MILVLSRILPQATQRGSVQVSGLCGRELGGASVHDEVQQSRLAENLWLQGEDADDLRRRGYTTSEQVDDMAIVEARSFPGAGESAIDVR